MVVTYTMCREYVNRLSVKLGKDITITIYPGVHIIILMLHRRNECSKLNLPGRHSRINCRFVEEAEYDNLVVLEKDKDNKELDNFI